LSETKGTADDIADRPVEYLKQLDLAKDPNKLVLDGWKQKFIIHATQGKNDFTIRSEALEKYKAKHGNVGPAQSSTDDDDGDS